MAVTGSHTIASGPSLPRLVDLRAYDATGVGHVLPGRFETRHPCGEQVRAERFAHPARTYCPGCVGGGVTESEQRAMWGDR